MKYAVIDTETSGLFDFSKPSEAEGQPRLASLAIILLDESLTETYRRQFFIKPDGWKIPAAMDEINGLSNDYLTKVGVPVKEVLDAYGKVVDSGRAIVAFNAQFDTKIMRAELRRAGLPDRFETTPNICVMRAATNFVKSPKKTRNGYKFPKLSEACSHFGINLTDKHSAIDDALAAADIFRALKKLDACPDPEVHYATNRPEPAKEEAAPNLAPVALQVVGSNNPPGPIDYARELMDSISKWMADHPVIVTEVEAREAKLFVDRAKTALEEVEVERDKKVRPLNESVTAINTEYKALHNSDGKKSGKWGLFDKIANELRDRFAAYLKVEEDKRVAAAAEAARVAQEKLDAARAAEAKEREAIENASLGEIGVNIAEVTHETDVAFKELEKAARVAEIAQVDTRFKVGGGFLRPTGLRTSKTLVLDDWKEAIEAIGSTEKIREAILASARDYRKLYGRLPKGVSEVEDRVL